MQGVAALDDWSASVEGTVRRIVRLTKAGQLTEDEAVGAHLETFRIQRASVTTKQTEAQVGRQLIARYDELIAQGRGCGAAMMVARELGEPHEWTTIVKRLYRLRDARKKRAA